MPPLDNLKRERFCREYVIDLNATQAAIRAGYSAKTANRIASAMLSKVDVSSRVSELQDPIIQGLEITHESVLREIDETRRAAAAAEQHSVALKAAELKGRHIGMWPNKIEHSGKIGLASLIAETPEKPE